MTPEFSRPIRLEELSTKERSYDIEAAEDERAALAKRFDLQSIGRLSAAVRLKAEATDRMVRLKARFEAEVVQTCVVTLDPVPAHVEGEFEVLYDRALRPAGREVMVEAGGVDVMPLEGETLDIGEAVAEELSLSLDPYPKAPGAAVEAGAATPGGRNRPFEILARLKSKH